MLWKTLAYGVPEKEEERTKRLLSAIDVALDESQSHTKHIQHVAIRIQHTHTDV